MSDGSESRNDAIRAALAPDHECCPCVERLRAQNKASSDDWTKRTAKMQSQLHGLNALMSKAVELNNDRKTAGGWVLGGMSAYGQAALAVALKEADEAAHEAMEWRSSFHDERRHRVWLEAQMATMRKRIAQLEREAADAT